MARSPDFGSLLENSGWVRALAESLVADPNVADDLLQDAYVAALSGHARVQGGLGGWLGGVVRNLARRESRTAGRRRHRESEAARPDAVPPADELLEQAELQKRVIGAVTELPEPYRSTLLLRFFEGLSVEEIARRQGVPGSTGRTRLKRGLAKLRERFDREHGGDRAAWCALLVKLAPDRGAVTAGAAATGGVGLVHGVMAMNGAVKVAIAGAVVVAGLVGWWHWQGEPEAAQPREGAAAAPATVAQVEAVKPAAELAAQPEIEQQERRALAAQPEKASVPVEASVATPEATEAHVRARIRDADGRAVPGARFTVENGSSEEMASARSEADGDVYVEVPIALPTTSVNVAVSAPGLATRFVAARLTRGETTHLGDVVLGPAGVLSGIVQDARGNPILGARVFVSDVGGTREDATQARRHGPLLRQPVPETESDPVGHFELEGVAAGFVRVWATTPRHAYASLGPIEVTADSRTDDLVFVLEELFDQDTIEGIVLSPDGEPVRAQLRFAYQYAQSRTSSSTPVGEDGRFSLTLDHHVPYELCASDPENRWADVVAHRVAPGTLDLVLRFQDPRWIALTAVDEKGRPVTELGLEAQESRRGGHYETLERIDVAEQADGVLRFIEPLVAYEIGVDAPGYERLTLGPYEPGQTPETLAAELVALPGVHGRVVADGRPVSGAKVALWDVVDDDTLYLKNGFRCGHTSPWKSGTTSDENGDFHLYPRRSDAYVLRVEKDGYAPSERDLTVDVEETVEDVEIELGQGGTIVGRVIVPPGRGVAGVIVGINHGDGNAQTYRVGPDGTYRFDGLATGGWQVLARDEELAPNTSSSSIAPNPKPGPIEWSCEVFEGQTTTFDLDLRERDAVRLVGRLDLGDDSPAGWTASLKGSGELAMNKDVVAGLLGEDGAFELEVPVAGSYRLEVRAPQDRPHGLVIASKLQLEPGETVWEESLALGRISGQGAPADAEAILEYRWLGSLSADAGADATVRVRLEPEVSGLFTIPFVPAGPGEIVRYETSGGEAWGSWERVLAFDVVAGEEKEIFLP